MPDSGVPSVRERILRHVTELLEAGHALKPLGMSVHRFQQIPLWKDDLPAVIPYWRAETIEEEDQDLAVMRRLTLRLEHRHVAKGATPSASAEIPDQKLDGALIWSTVVMLQDRTMGGLAVDVREVATAVDTIEVTETYVGAGQDWEITYWTAADDPMRGA